MAREKPYTWSQTITDSKVRLYRLGEPERPYWIGTVATQFGYVQIYAESDVTVYRFMKYGREYAWTERKGRTERGIGIVAGRYARRITQEVGA